MSGSGDFKMLKLKNTLVIFQKPVRSLSTVQPLCASRYYNAKIALTQKKGTMRGMDRLLRQEFQKQSREENKGAKSTPKNPVMYDTNKTRVFNRQFMENIGQALAGIPEFLGHGISITKVSLNSGLLLLLLDENFRSMSNQISLRLGYSG